MVILRLRKIQKTYINHTILREINLDIKVHSKIGLVGNNGCGKTTLAKIITGLEDADSGVIEPYVKNIKISYLKQSSEFNEKHFNDLILNKSNDLKDIFAVSSHLGLQSVKDWQEEKLNHLSGGEKTKLSLTEVFNEKCDVLILDEPTNHLDSVGIDWLIKEIKKFPKALIIISHDRYFLDQVAEEIVELENGILSHYNGNYSTYRKLKEEQYETTCHQYEEQKKREQQISNEINRLKKWSHLAHRDSTKKEGFKEYYRVKAKKKDVQIKSKIRRLEKMRNEGLKKPTEEEKIVFEFIGDKKAGRNLVRAENLCKAYPDKPLFKNSRFYITRGERVGLIGVNGCGKTTLINMILGYDADYKGSLDVSTSAKIAYLSQDVLDLDEEMSIDEMIEKKPREYQTKLRTLLASSGITDRIIKQKIKTLSLGERTRIKLVILIMDEHNVLILDEPTNHLDLHSREQLEKTLDSYQGTIIIASHDRYLLEKITDKLLIFENRAIKRLEVGFQAYKENQKKEKLDKKVYDLMVIQNRITYILSELSKYKETDKMYQKLDQEFKDLVQKRNSLIK